MPFTTLLEPAPPHRGPTRSVDARIASPHLPELETAFDAHLVPSPSVPDPAIGRREVHRDRRRLRRWARRHLVY